MPEIPPVPSVALANPNWSIAALVHGLTWNGGRSGRRVADGIRIAGVRGSRVGRLYRKLCTEQNVDDGEPLGFDVYLEFSHSDAVLYPYTLEPCSPLARGLTLLSVLMAFPLPACRLIWSKDDFSSAYATNTLFDYRPQNEVMYGFHQKSGRGHRWPVVDTGVCRAMATSWSGHAAAEGRLERALTFFQHAWLAHNLDVMCLSLSVVLETLCAPHTQSETTHQVAFNVAHLIGGDAAKKRATYDSIKTFYGLRSRITHGGDPDETSLKEVVPMVFELVANLLRRLLLKPDLALIVNDEKKRRRLFFDYMFPAR